MSSTNAKVWVYLKGSGGILSWKILKLRASQSLVFCPAHCTWTDDGLVRITFFFKIPPPPPQKLNSWLLIGYFVVDLLDDAFWGCWGGRGVLLYGAHFGNAVNKFGITAENWEKWNFLMVTVQLGPAPPPPPPAPESFTNTAYFVLLLKNTKSTVSWIT